MSERKMNVSVYQQPKDGNVHCGDSYFYQESDHEFVCAIADGLGSGEFAKESSQVVIDIIKKNSSATVDELVEKCNQELLGKRGVVIGVFKIDFLEKKYTFSSIGNIGFIMAAEGEKKKRMIPNSGYLAGFKRPFKINEGKLKPNTIFIMFSDGVEEKELIESYFLNRDVRFITETYKKRMGGSARDDTTLIAMQYQAE